MEVLRLDSLPDRWSPLCPPRSTRDASPIRRGSGTEWNRPDGDLAVQLTKPGLARCCVKNESGISLGTLRSNGLLIDRAKHHIVLGQDSGIRLNAVNADQLYERFYRTCPAENHADGGGLGLPIVKAIADRCGEGTVTARSPGPREGSTFEVPFPGR